MLDRPGLQEIAKARVLRATPSFSVIIHVLNNHNIVSWKRDDHDCDSGPRGRRNRERDELMDQATHNKIVSFVWGIADDVLRDLFRRGKYPDVILPMCVLRRLDAVLEPTKKTVLETKKMLDDEQSNAPRFTLPRGKLSTTYRSSRCATSNREAASSNSWPILKIT